MPVMESSVQGQPWLYTVVLKAKLLNWLDQTLSINNLQNEFRNGSCSFQVNGGPGVEGTPEGVSVAVTLSPV